MLRRTKAAVALAVLVMLPQVALAGPSVPEVHAKLREIESARVKGTVDPIRMQYQDQARHRPGDVLLRVYLAWCEMPSDDSWNQLKNISTIHPDDLWVRLGMGRVYLKWKMRDQAEGEFRHALKVNPRFYPAMVGLGDVLRNAGDLDGALAQYEAALKIQDDPEAHGGIGWIKLAKKDNVGAKAALARSVALWPEQPRLISQLVKLSREEKDLKAAADWSEKLAELTPRDANARKVLAELRLEAGDKVNAAKEYERAVRLGVVETEVFRKLASLQRELGNAESEQRAVEQLSVLEKQNAEHPARLSELAVARGDLEAAEAQLLEAIDRVGTRSDLHARLAQVRVKRELYRDALDAYRAALAAPENRAEGLEAEAAALAERFKLPKKPAKGTLDQVYWRVSSGLNAFYQERLKQKPGLEGAINVRVEVDATGKVKEAAVIEDTVGDPWLAGHAYFALKDATFPKKAGTPIFEFEFKAPKGKGKK